MNTTSPMSFQTTDYWEKRYCSGGNSGRGSYGALAAFKAEIINTFIRDNHIGSVIEFGCGDGTQAALGAYPRYLGVDPSVTAVRICKERFYRDASKRFITLNEFTGEKAQLTLSLDVLYHLIEDDVYETHLRLLFASAQSYVIIYSSNACTVVPPTKAPHIKHRAFTAWVESNATGWRLIKRVPNRYPYSGCDQTGTWSDFFIYEKQMNTSNKAVAKLRSVLKVVRRRLRMSMSIPSASDGEIRKCFENQLAPALPGSPTVRCPICGGGRFAPYRGRPNERCAGCGAKERTRLMALILRKLPRNYGCKNIMHFAPETCLVEPLRRKYGDNYTPLDLNPQNFQIGMPVEEFDMTKDFSSVSNKSVYMLLHSHVLEHVPCDIHQLLDTMNSKLIEGGYHVFCIPLLDRPYDEDWSSDLTDQDRERRFGQHDHVRAFSIRDFETRFAEPFTDFDRVPLWELVAPEEAHAAAVKASSVSRLFSPSTFVFQKRTSKP